MSFYSEYKEAVDIEIEQRFDILEEKYNLLPQVGVDFRSDEQLVNRSDVCYMGNIKIGNLYWLSDEEKKMVKKIEDEYDIKVYHVILSHTNLGDMYSLLYVSSYMEEWEDDKTELKEGYPFAYVYNASDPYLSEFGSISIGKGCGGIVRHFS